MKKYFMPFYLQFLYSKIEYRCNWDWGNKVQWQVNLLEHHYTVVYDLFRQKMQPGNKWLPRWKYISSNSIKIVFKLLLPLLFIPDKLLVLNIFVYVQMIRKRFFVTNRKTFIRWIKIWCIVINPTEMRKTVKLMSS